MKNTERGVKIKYYTTHPYLFQLLKNLNLKENQDTEPNNKRVVMNAIRTAD